MLLQYINDTIIHITPILTYLLREKKEASFLSKAKRQGKSQIIFLPYTWAKEELFTTQITTDRCTHFGLYYK